MTTDTPAAQLKQGADKLRTLLADPDLTPGPWLSLDGGDRIIHDGPSIEFGRADYVIDEPVGNAANAELIAAMHPGVGLALADWLDEQSALLNANTRPDWQETVASRALAVARALLGEATR